MILVTGAAGKTGLEVIRAVSTLEKVRAFVYRPGSSDIVTQAGASEIVAGDMRNLVDFERATRGVRAVYHICPNVNPYEVEIGQIATATALKAGVENFVYHSVLHPQIEAMPHHWNKMRVEELLFASGIPYTLLQPASYMQNVLAQRENIVERGIYETPYSIEARLAMVDLEDVARVAARVITQPGHSGATYELVGETHSQSEVAEVIGSVIGRPVRAMAISTKEWKRRAKQAGMGNPQIETLVKMFRFYDEHGLAGNPSALTWLLERPPTDLATCLQRVLSSE